MNTPIRVDVLAPSALGALELEAWRAFRAASPRMASPYFAPEYSMAADGTVPGAAVAVIHRGGDIEAFLPFQRRGGLAQPLAAPLSDYNGLIARPDADLDWTAVVRGLGAASYAFSGLVTQRPPVGGRAFVHDGHVAHVGGGLETYLEGRPKTRKFFKDKARRARALATELGELEFHFEDESEVFDFIINQKRAQYLRTGRHDIFACGWTERFLRRLWEMRTPEFGGRFTTLRAGGRLVSAEYGLRGVGVHHLWFPAYDPEYARLGPGTTMTIETIKAAAAAPELHSVDFGPSAEAYKSMYTSPTGVVYEGTVEAASLRIVSSRVADAALAAPPLQRLAEARDRLRRRFAIINACETTTSGWVGGAVSAFRQAARRAAPQTALEA
jgi:CelD/BcsL family acetyltransferase involved in cellulose biosynthesis